MISALAKYHDQPVLYLMDLVDVSIPKSVPLLRDKYKGLLQSCLGLRCPTCGDDTLTCMPIPSDYSELDPNLNEVPNIE